MISERSRLSLAQYLALQRRDFLDVLCRKPGLRAEWEQWRDWADSDFRGLVALMPELSADRLLAVLEEIASTEADLSDRASGPWGDGASAYRERWGDLRRCLALD